LGNTNRKSIFTVAGAQAADLPTKAQPVEYVRACSLYGAGFWYVPGTDTCVKIGAFVRLQVGYGASGGGSFTGGAPGPGVNGEGDFGGAFSRTTNMFNFQSRGAISFDMRQQTEYGTLRSYIDVGAGVQTNNGGYGGSATTQPLGANASYGATTVYTDRAFLQFAGFTVGRIRSFFDMVNPGAYSIASTASCSASSATFCTDLAVQSPSLLPWRNSPTKSELRSGMADFDPRLTSISAPRMASTLRPGALTRVAGDLVMYAKTMSAATAAVLFSLVAIDGATAEGGCGPGFHRNEFGRCRPNRPVVVVPGAPVVVAPAAPLVVAPAPVVCGAGYRWHPRFRRCVVL
jgi:Porin subfamily